MRTWYYSRNRKQFGPVGIEELKRLLGTGGLDLEDLVWREGMAEWLPVSAVGELSAPPLPPEGHFDQAPAADVPPSDDGRDVFPGSQPLLVSQCLAHATRRLMAQPLLLLMAGMIYFISVVGISLAGQWIDQLCHYQPPVLEWIPGDAEANKQLSEIFGAQSMPVRVVQTLVEWFITLGIMRIALAVLRREATSLRDLFRVARRFPKVAIANILYFVMVTAGLILFIAPGIYLGIRFSQFRYGILERNLGIMESFAFSAAITRNSFFPIILLNLLATFVIIAGSMLFLIGIVPAMPFAMMIQAAIYHWLTKGARNAFQG